MTPTQSRFVELERKKEDIKKYYEQLKEATEALAKELGINGHFIDDQGIVYQVVEPEGKFVTFEKISYIRTKRPHEKRGDLSVKKAQELGYEVQ